MTSLYTKRDIKKEKVDQPSKQDLQGKLDTNFYVPKYKEYKPRAKDIADKKERIAAQKEKGLLQDAPGVQTEKGKEYVKQLEDLTGEKQDKIGTYKEAPGGGTPLARGTKAPSDEWVKEHRQMQPRDPATGQFEYNNANAKGVKYPSRGKKAVMFIKGGDFDKIFNRNEHIIIDEQGRTAIARLDMTAEEFKEGVINASEKLGFTTRWTSETKKGRKSKAEHEALDRGDKGRLGNRVFNKKGEKVSDYSNKTQQSYGDLSKGQERQIVASDSDQDKFKIDVDTQNEIKAMQERNKRQQEFNRTGVTTDENGNKIRTSNNRLARDKKLNSAWGKTDNISDEMVEAISELTPNAAFQNAKDQKKAAARIMNMKDKNGNRRFKNFEDYRHWALAYRANKYK